MEALLKALPPTPERFRDGLRGGGKAPLENCERPPDQVTTSPLPLLGQPFGPIHPLADILGYLPVKLGLQVGKLVVDGVGPSPRKKRGPVELEELFLYDAPHEVRGVDHVHPIP